MTFREYLLTTDQDDFYTDDEIDLALRLAAEEEPDGPEQYARLRHVEQDIQLLRNLLEPARKPEVRRYGAEFERLHPRDADGEFVEREYIHGSHEPIEDFDLSHASAHQLHGIYFTKPGGKLWGNRVHLTKVSLPGVSFADPETAKKIYLEEMGKGGKDYGKRAADRLKGMGYDGADLGKHEVVVWNLEKIRKQEPSEHIPSWQPNLFGGQPQSVASQRTFEQAAPGEGFAGTPKQTGPKDLPGQMFMYAKGCQWITIGARTGPDGKKHGGTPVCVEGGRIVKGHPGLTGRKIDALKEEPEESTHRKELHQSKGHARAVAAKKARAEGIDPSHLHQLAAEILAHNREYTEDQNRVVKDVRAKLTKFPEQYGWTIQEVRKRANQGKDQQGLFRFDLLAKEMALSYPDVFGGIHDEDYDEAQDKLWNLLKEGNLEPMSEEDAYEQAMGTLREYQTAEPVEAEEPVPFSRPGQPRRYESSALPESEWQIGPYTVRIADDEHVRSEGIAEEDFGPAAIHEDYPHHIPEGEIWLAESVDDAERELIAEAARQRCDALKEGKSSSEAYAAAEKYAETEYAKRRDEWPLANILQGWWGDVAGMRVELVNGRAVRAHYKWDFSQGGNSAAYDWMPPNRIWIDASMHASEFPYVVLHEFVEDTAIKQLGIDYDAAHELASKAERKARERRLIRPDVLAMTRAHALVLIGEAQGSRKYVKDAAGHEHAPAGSPEGGQFVSTAKSLKAAHPFPAPMGVETPGLGNPKMLAESPELREELRKRDEHTHRYWHAWIANFVHRMLVEPPERDVPLPNEGASRANRVHLAKRALDNVDAAAGDLGMIGGERIGNPHAGVTASHPEGERALAAAKAEGERRYKQAVARAEEHLAQLPEDLRAKVGRALKKAEFYSKADHAVDEWLLDHQPGEIAQVNVED